MKDVIKLIVIFVLIIIIGKQLVYHNQKGKIVCNETPPEYLDIILQEDLDEWQPFSQP